MTTTFDPGQVVSDVETGASRLEDAAEKLYDAEIEWEAAEEAYDSELSKLRLEADFRFFDSHNKMPSQERRQDMAVKVLQEERADIYIEYHRAKANKEALALKYRALSAAVSARQSLLKVLAQ